MTITEILNSADYTEGTPKVLVGYCFSTLTVVGDDFTTTKLKGLHSDVAVGGDFEVSIQCTRTLQTEVLVGGGFTCYKLDPSSVINTPSLSPTHPDPGPGRVLPDLSGDGGPPSFDLGNYEGTPLLTLSRGTDSITIKAPEFGNSSSLETKRIQAQTMGGTLVIYRDESWDKHEKFSLSIENLTKTEMSELKGFLRRNVGKTLTLIDHLKLTWQVKHTNPDADFVEGPNRRYGYKLELETVE